MNKENDLSFLKRRLAQGVLQHQEWSKNYSELQDATRNGQKPTMIIYHNGTVDPAGLFGLPPARAFCAGGFPLILRHPDKTHDDGAIYPFLAAAVYASKVLGVEKQVMVISDNGPLRAYKSNQRTMGPMMAPWAAIWNEVVQEAQVFAEQAGVTDAAEYHHLTSLALLHRNADIMESIVGTKVTCCYLDMEKGVLEIHPHANLADMWHNGDQVQIDNLGLYPDTPRALACSCCDSRAGHGHLYCARPGEFFEANVISAIVPPYKGIIENKIAHPVWALTEHAYGSGVRKAVVTGHSQCGGIKALLDWKALGQHPGRYLDAWLGQAGDVIEEVIAYAKQQGFLFNADGSIQDEAYRLAERRVTQWSARNLQEYFKDRAQETGETFVQGGVLAHYLNIQEREVYVLDAYATIDETYRKRLSMKALVQSLPQPLDDGEPLPALWNASRCRKAGQFI